MSILVVRVKAVMSKRRASEEAAVANKRVKRLTVDDALTKKEIDDSILKLKQVPVLTFIAEKDRSGKLHRAFSGWREYAKHHGLVEARADEANRMMKNAVRTFQRTDGPGYHQHVLEETVGRKFRSVAFGSEEGPRFSERRISIAKGTRWPNENSRLKSVEEKLEVMRYKPLNNNVLLYFRESYREKPEGKLQYTRLADDRVELSPAIADDFRDTGIFSDKFREDILSRRKTFPGLEPL